MRVDVGMVRVEGGVLAELYSRHAGESLRLAYLLTGDAAAADPVCDKSPHHHLIEAAVTLAQGEEGRSQIQPLVWRTYPLADAGEALATLERREHFGKIVLKP